eukprot:symbB.v1.2.021368.t1/scaffold1843.1/size100617/4
MDHFGSKNEAVVLSKPASEEGLDLEDSCNGRFIGSGRNQTKISVTVAVLNSDGRRIAALPSAGAGVNPLLTLNAVSMDSLICGVVHHLHSQNQVLQELCFSGAAEHPADAGDLLHDHHMIVRLMKEVVRRFHTPPEAWAMENPRRGGPPLYPKRWHTGFFGSFSSGYVVFSIV